MTNSSILECLWLGRTLSKQDEGPVVLVQPCRDGFVQSHMHPPSNGGVFEIKIIGRQRYRLDCHSARDLPSQMFARHVGYPAQ